MKILIISRGVPNRHDPQDGCFEMDQALALRKAGHEVVVMAIDSNARKFWRPLGLTIFNYRGIKAYRMFVFPSNLLQMAGFNKTAIWIQKLQARWLYHRIVREWGEFDIIHAHFFQKIALAVDLKEKYGCRIVGTEHWSEIAKQKIDRGLIDIGKKIYPECDALLSVSASLAGNIKANFNQDSTVVHNMIGEEFDNASPEKVTKTAKFRFISTGSLIPRKNHSMLVEAFRRSGLQDRAEVLIIGAGSLRQKLQTQIDNAGLHDSVRLLGKKNKPQIAELLQSSDAFVFPSNNENFSVAVLEALAFGLPVIATTCGGIRECIDKSNGKLVPVNDPDAMSRAMREMIESICSYDRKGIRTGCMSRFSPQGIAARLTQIYETTLDKASHK